jgi:LacI family transcriptional regulator
LSGPPAVGEQVVAGHQVGRVGGEIQHRRRRPTSRDIARVAGVSQTTVSGVLSGSELVRPSTRERVLDVLREQGYSPNAIARAMVTGRTATIGVVVANVTNPFYPALLEAIADELERFARRMTLWTSGAASEPAAIEAIGAGLVDGVIFTDAIANSPALHKAIRQHAPIVLVNRSLCDTVTTDNIGGGRAVARHLLALGHRRRTSRAEHRTRTRGRLPAGPRPSGSAVHHQQ